jgi:hypothetical protein
MRDYKVKTIGALHRGLQVLEFLHDAGAASLHDLNRETGIPKPTLIRILHTLHSDGLVWQRMADGAFLPSQVRSRSPWRPRVDDAAWLSEVASGVLEGNGLPAAEHVCDGGVLLGKRRRLDRSPVRHGDGGEIAIQLRPSIEQIVKAELERAAVGELNQR